MVAFRLGIAPQAPHACTVRGFCRRSSLHVAPVTAHRLDRPAAASPVATQQAITLVVGQDFPIFLDCLAEVGSSSGVTGLSGGQLPTEVRSQLRAIDVVAAQVVDCRGPVLWLRGSKRLADISAAMARSKTVLVELPGGSGRAAQRELDTVFLPRSCACWDEYGFVGFDVDLGLAARLHSLEATSGEDCFNALYRMAALLEKNLQATPNYNNKLGPAYSSVFQDILPASVRSEVCKAAGKSSSESSAGGVTVAGRDPAGRRRGGGGTSGWRCPW